jgi:hypothetical protein
MKKALAVVALISALALTGCGEQLLPEALPTLTSGSSSTPTPTPTPTPEPTRPAISDLVVYPGGLDYLRVGMSVESRPDELAIVQFDDTPCSADTPADVIGWVPNYEGEPFTLITARDGTLTAILVRDSAIMTEEGIRVGSTRSEVVAAYPDASFEQQGVTDVYLVDGPYGTLKVEVANGGNGEFLDQVDTVVWMATMENPVWQIYPAFGPCV